MKRYLLTLLLSLLFTGVFAQESRWHFGVKGGVGKSGSAGSKFTEFYVFDDYKRKTTYSIGVRISYQFLRHFAVALDPEFQMLADSRMQIIPAYAVSTEQNIMYTDIQNRFERLQLPIALQYYPFLWKVRPYVTAGILPYYITKGKVTERTTYTNIPGESFESIWKTDFDLYANKEIRSNAPLFAGFGFGIGKNISVEITTTFSKRMEIQLDNPLPTFRMPRMGHNYAMRNTRFALILQL